MKSGSITTSEMMHLHELLNFRVTRAVISDALQSRVADQRLSKILEQDVSAAKQQLQDLKNILTQAGAVG